MGQRENRGIKMTQVKTKKPTAIIVSDAVCRGKGSDKWKWVSGITRGVVELCRDIDPTATLLVPSNTNWRGQKYKSAVHTACGWKHRQITVSEFQILGEVSVAEGVIAFRSSPGLEYSTIGQITINYLGS